MDDKQTVGLVELVEIDLIHRNAEFQIIIDPQSQGKGYASIATKLAIEYAFTILNLHKIYQKTVFQIEGELKEEFFINGSYHDAIRMCMFQRDFLNN